MEMNSFNCPESSSLLQTWMVTWLDTVFAGENLVLKFEYILPVLSGLYRVSVEKSLLVSFVCLFVFVWGILLSVTMGMTLAAAFKILSLCLIFASTCLSRLCIYFVWNSYTAFYSWDSISSFTLEKFLANLCSKKHYVPFSLLLLASLWYKYCSS